jgi:transcriptional regulator with XRE-family HTH domain
LQAVFGKIFRVKNPRHGKDCALVIRIAESDALMDAAAAIRLRFRELLEDRGMSQRTLAHRLTKRTGALWRESRLSKLLNGQIAFEVADLILMADEAGISMVELVRQPGREFVADMTPTELRIVQAMRDRPELEPLLKLVVGDTPRRKPSRRIIRERMRLDR